ncbi:cupin domain-containing protein [Paenibacillus eucommiae]|uniref:Cupin superfamily sugar epimerase n=1 Tax=Paenibacillus eucommiae TaxID=1355755 RepID=A0ABS4ITS0_9BACL|nr:cupin domain-containing protein [Paenibacillus eucommiae]MBP1990421.1 putative cupin superfamily sugar epimerase [Paenibacillus eucommiae]
MEEKLEEKKSPFLKSLDLQYHFEGAWYRRTYASDVEIPQEILGEKYSGARPSATCIYYLMHPGEVSRWHKIASTEIWIWQSGGTVKLTMGGEGDQPGEGSDYILGLDIEKGQHPHVIVPPGVWQMAVNDSDEPVLFTCVVTPGFHTDEHIILE